MIFLQIIFVFLFVVASAPAYAAAEIFVPEEPNFRSMEKFHRTETVYEVDGLFPYEEVMSGGVNNSKRPIRIKLDQVPKKIEMLYIYQGTIVNDNDKHGDVPGTTLETYWKIIPALQDFDIFVDEKEFERVASYFDWPKEFDCSAAGLDSDPKECEQFKKTYESYKVCLPGESCEDIKGIMSLSEIQLRVRYEGRDSDEIIRIKFTIGC